MKIYTGNKLIRILDLQHVAVYSIEKMGKKLFYCNLDNLPQAYRRDLLMYVYNSIDDPIKELVSECQHNNMIDIDLVKELLRLINGKEVVTSEDVRNVIDMYNLHKN